MNPRKPLIALTVALLPGAALLASQGKAPIHKATVINQAGSYELTKDITDDTTDPVISITANDVTLDLDGHTISSSGSNTLIAAVGKTNLRITNGKLTGGNRGVSLTVGVSGPKIIVQVDNLNVRGQSGSGSKGIYIAGNPGGNKAVVIVEGNSVDAQQTADYAIQLDDIANSRVENNVAQNAYPSGTQGWGLSVGGVSQRVIIRGNVASGNRYGGMPLNLCHACDISYNVASGNGGGTDVGAGITVYGDTNTVSFNTSCQNNGSGIAVNGSGNYLHDNTTSSNTGSGHGQGDGIFIDDGSSNTIESNSCAGNQNYGIEVDTSGNCIRDNSTPGNARNIAGGQSCDSNNLP